jgi:hypothetical protein
MTTISHSANQHPTKRPAVARGSFLSMLTCAVTGAVLTARLAEARRIAARWISGMLARGWRAVHRVGRLIVPRPVRSLGRAIAKPTVRIAAVFRTGWSWSGRAGPELDGRARSVETAAEMATEPPGRRTGSAQTGRNAWFAQDPPPKPHRERARQSPSGQKQKHRDERQRTRTKTREGMQERLPPFLARRLPRFTSADAAKASRFGGQRQYRGWFEREGTTSSRRPESSQPRQTCKTQPSRNRSVRAGKPRPATALKVEAATSAPRRPRVAPERCISLVAQDLIRPDCLVPGKRRDGKFIWQDEAGRSMCVVGCEGNLIDPADASLRLRFSNFHCRTGLRRLVDQRVWLAASPDRTSWRFNNGRSLSERLDMRPGDRFRFPSVPGSRPARQRPRERAPANPIAAKRARRPISLHIDLLFSPGTLKHLEIRRGVWSFGDNLDAVAFEANTVDPDKNRFFARYAIQDEAGRRVIEQEFALVWDAEAWWFKDEKGHMSAQLVFRAGRFRISPPRLASKPPCIPPQQPAQPCDADTPSAPLQQPARPGGTDIPGTPDRDGGDGPRTKSDPIPRRDWLLSKLAKAKATAKRLFADVIEEPLRKAGVRPRARALKSNLARIVAGTCSLVAGLTMRLMGRLGIVDRSRPAV